MEKATGSAWDMNTWGTVKGKTIPFTPTIQEDKPQPEANGGGIGNGNYWGYNRIFSLPYDGENELGGIGPIKKYIVDHIALRMRAWQLYLESDVVSALFKRSAFWGIGEGLKLQAEPKIKYLASQKISITGESFNNASEEAFGIYANSTICDFQNLRTLSDIAAEAWTNAEMGDVLLILRIVDGMPKVQIKDGTHVRTPLGFTTMFGFDVINPANKNRIRHGVEINTKGEQVAYWVQTGLEGQTISDFERIECRMNKYPYCETARLIYGDKYRIDNTRGVPIIASVMETASKLGRYMSAALSSAEERAKVSYFIKHSKNSTGEHPLIASMAAASGVGFLSDLPTDSLGNDLSNKVAATTNKQVVNMPLESELVSLESKQELHVRDFFTVNFDILCAVVGYPPEVILSKYDSNYSASRAAIKDFEHTLDVKRGRFAKQFYQVIYNFWLDYMVLSDSIDAPGYMEALASKNMMSLTAYRSARWKGDNVPHIDPLKEVLAWRLKLGKDSENYPLCTMEDAAEALTSSGWDGISEQYSKEMESGRLLGFEKVLGRGEGKEDNQGDDEVDEKPQPTKIAPTPPKKR